MARKSRKFEQDASVTSLPQSEALKTAIYARLSVENSGKNDDGDSIENQINFCKEYIKERPYLKLVEVFEDNGQKGTNFERPQFNKLMEKLRKGKINCIVVNDLSRFGRDYIETGNYLEKVFPFLGVRFIAVTDGYDSFEANGSEEALMVPLKNMLNELYAKDISRKVITSIRARQEKGEFLPGMIPYGYLKSKTDPYGYVIDEKVAEYIKLAFRLRIEGNTYKKIATILNDMGAVSPGRRKYELGLFRADMYKNSKWTIQIVRDILFHPVYTGCLVYGKQPKSLYEGIKEHNAPSSEWKIIPDHHEPIISKEDFDKVMEIKKATTKKFYDLRKKNKKERDQIVDIFEGKFFCGDCGNAMRMKKLVYKKKSHPYSTYSCGRGINPNNDKCTTHYITELDIRSIVLEQLKKQIQLACDFDLVVQKLKGAGGNGHLAEQYAGVIRSNELKFKQIQKKLEKLYESYCEGFLKDDEYLYAKKEYEKQSTILLELVNEARERKRRLSQLFSGENKWLKHMKVLKGIKELNKKVVEDVISKILIYETPSGKSVELIFRYKDDYEAMLEIIENESKVMK